MGTHGRKRPARTAKLTDVVGYVRVSSEKQAEKGLSLKEQRGAIKLHARTNDLNLLRVETDAGRSAHSIRRPGLERALASLRSGEAQGLVVVKLDRLTRRLRDLLALVDDYFDLDSGGGHLISLGESFDTRSPAGRAMLQLVGVFSEWERAMARTRTMEVMEGKRERGEHLGGEPPYGYRVQDGKLVADLQEQEAMRAARDLRRLDYALQTIADALNENEVPRRNGRPWTRQAVGRMLE